MMCTQKTVFAISKSACLHVLKLGGFKLTIPHSRVASTLQILLTYANFYVKFAKLRTIWKRVGSSIVDLKPPNWHTTTIQSARSLKWFLSYVFRPKLYFFDDIWVIYFVLFCLVLFMLYKKLSTFEFFLKIANFFQTKPNFE